MLQTLREHKLYDKFRKCEFWLDRMVFLRHVVIGAWIFVDQTKVELVINWPRLMTVIEIQSF